MSKISNEAIEAIATAFIKQAREYGFELMDYIKLSNLLLESALRNGTASNNQHKPKPRYSAAPSKLPLKGEHLFIRGLQKKDIPIIKKWLEDVEGRNFILSRISGTELTIDDLIESEFNIFGLICLNDKTPIGLIAYLDYDEIQKKAELRKMIGVPTERGKGYANEASKLWIEYGLYSLGLEKIYLTTFNTDIRNIRINEMLGFRVEGIMRNEVKVDGEYRDILKMSLLKEWIEK